MRDFFKNYSLGKHIGIVTALYSVIGLAGNLILFIKQLDKAEREKEKKAGSWLASLGKKETVKAVAINYVKKPSAVVKIFNGVVGACLLVDLCAYPLVKKMSEKL